MGLGDKGFTRQAGQHVQHADIQHLPGTDLLFNHHFADVGVIDRHGKLIIPAQWAGHFSG
ncbi:hypothetical protein D3C71_1224240 [compost metagenome]